MTHVSTFSTAKAQALDLHHHRLGLSALQRMMERYRVRRRFRLDLQRMLDENPHLIPDIGLTTREAKAEIAKPFWQD